MVAFTPQGERPVGQLETGDEAGMHPDVIRKFVALGILDAAADSSKRALVWPGPSRGPGQEFSGCAPAFRLNYAPIGLVTDLLDRISALEAALRQARRPGGG